MASYLNRVFGYETGNLEKVLDGGVRAGIRDGDVVVPPEGSSGSLADLFPYGPTGSLGGLLWGWCVGGAGICDGVEVGAGMKKLTVAEIDVLLALERLGEIFEDNKDGWFDLDFVARFGGFKRGISTTMLQSLRDKGFIERGASPIPGHEETDWLRTGYYSVCIRKVMDFDVDAGTVKNMLENLYRDTRRMEKVLERLEGSEAAGRKEMWSLMSALALRKREVVS